MIENVGNLVCPAEFDVGEDAKAMVYAVTEGEEKPLKYPVMFRAADVVVVNKIDLLPHLDVDLDRLLANVDAVNPTARIIRASVRTGREWTSGASGWRRLEVVTLWEGHGHVHDVDRSVPRRHQATGDLPA